VSLDDVEIPIERGLVTSTNELAELRATDRYKITESGVSKRWVPGTSPAGYYGNSDEHKEDGVITEEADEAAAMVAKRNRKMKTIMDALPDPEIYGIKKGAKVSLVGWGSPKNAVLDALEVLNEKGIKANYLHFEYLWPLKDEAFQKFYKENKNVHILENNFQGQLADILEGRTGLKFKGRLLKYNGRPFFVEDILDYVEKNVE